MDQPSPKSLKSLLSGFITKKIQALPPQSIVPQPHHDSKKRKLDEAESHRPPKFTAFNAGVSNPTRNLHVANLAPGTTEQ
jgi:hypothetical protein